MNSLERFLIGVFLLGWLSCSERTTTESDALIEESLEAAGPDATKPMSDETLLQTADRLRKARELKTGQPYVYDPQVVKEARDRWLRKEGTGSDNEKDLCGTQDGLVFVMQALAGVTPDNLATIKSSRSKKPKGKKTEGSSLNEKSPVRRAAATTSYYTTDKFEIRYWKSGDDALIYGTGDTSNHLVHFPEPFTAAAPWPYTSMSEYQTKAGNGVPDYVELAAVYLEYAWDRYYRDPDFLFDKGGDDQVGVGSSARITVAIANLDRSFSLPPIVGDACWIAEFMSYGLVEGCPTYNIGIQRDIDVGNLSGRIRLAQLVAHELFHQMEMRYVEMLTDFQESRNDGSLDSVPLEGTAEVAADAVWDRVPTGTADGFDLANQARDFLNSSNRTLFYDLTDQYHSYDTAIFWRFLMDQLSVHRYPNYEGELGMSFIRDFWQERYDEIDGEVCSRCADQSIYALNTLIQRVTKRMYENWDSYLNGEYAGDPRFPYYTGLYTKEFFVYFSIANYLVGFPKNEDYSSPFVHLEHRKDSQGYDSDVYSDYERGNLKSNWPRAGVLGEHTFAYPGASYYKEVKVNYWAANYFRFPIDDGNYSHLTYFVAVTGEEELARPYLAIVRRYENCFGWDWVEQLYDADTPHLQWYGDIPRVSNCGRIVELGAIVGERDYVNWLGDTKGSGTVSLSITVTMPYEDPEDDGNCYTAERTATPGTLPPPGSLRCSMDDPIVIPDVGDCHTNPDLCDTDPGYDYPVRTFVRNVSNVPMGEPFEVGWLVDGVELATDLVNTGPGEVFTGVDPFANLGSGDNVRSTMRIARIPYFSGAALTATAPAGLRLPESMIPKCQASATGIGPNCAIILSRRLSLKPWPRQSAEVKVQIRTAKEKEVIREGRIRLERIPSKADRDAARLKPKSK